MTIFLVSVLFILCPQTGHIQSCFSSSSFLTFGISACFIFTKVRTLATTTHPPLASSIEACPALLIVSWQSPGQVRTLYLTASACIRYRSSNLGNRTRHEQGILPLSRHSQGS